MRGRSWLVLYISLLEISLLRAQEMYRPPPPVERPVERPSERVVPDYLLRGKSTNVDDRVYSPRWDLYSNKSTVPSAEERFRDWNRRQRTIAESDASKVLSSLQSEIKRTDWTFIQMFREKSSLTTPVRRTDLKKFQSSVRFDDVAKAPSSLKNQLSLPLEELLALQTEQGIVWPLQRKLAQTDDQELNSRVALIFGSTSTQDGVVARTALDLKQRQSRTSRFTVVGGVTDPEDIRDVAGHIIQIHKPLSGRAMERTMDTLDRFILSFSGPRMWSGKVQTSRHALLFVHSKREDVVVDIDIEASAAQRRIVSNVLATSDGSQSNRQSFRQAVRHFLGTQIGKIVYVAGDTIIGIDIDEDGRHLGVGVVHRNLSRTASLTDTDRWLDDIRGRSPDLQLARVFNALPSTATAVQSLGAFAGDAENWQRLRSDVNLATEQIVTPRIASKEELFRELYEGESDIVLVIAHSDGTSIYFDGAETSLAALENLPTRSQHSRRARVAVLVSCYAGAEPKLEPAWRRWFASQRVVSSVADIFVRKGFVDRVIAPKGAVRTNEVLLALRSMVAAGPEAPAELMKGWINWVGLLRCFPERAS